MQKISLKNILIIIQRALNFIDDRMVGHGEEVAYIMYTLLKAQNKYTEDEILRITTVSMFHDIGAYKVEERQKIVDIDLDKPMGHAVYGSLFIKYFSPLGDLSEIVLGHHLYPKDLKGDIKEKVPKEALLLHLADSIAILQLNAKEVKKEWITDRTDDLLLPEHKDAFEVACLKYNLLDKIKKKSYVDELYEIFGESILSREEVISYAKMLTYAIDFRSRATVVHTILVEEISLQIAKLLKLDDITIRKIKIASMVHDIGKISIPIEILEKPGKLSKEEFESMKSHAIIGYRILSALGVDDIRDIASLHHERLDGSGYPFGLKEEEISQEIRIVTIGDIVSALVGKRSYKEAMKKEEVIGILRDMELTNKIDSHICNVVIENYDLIIKKSEENTKEILNLYNNLMDEYNSVLGYLESICNDKKEFKSIKE